MITQADIRQTNHYYPFGLNMEGNWTSRGGNGEGNKYQYNNKELNDDFGLGWNDYGGRFYDAAVGRFPMVDRFAEKYVIVNPYQYAANNPIKFIDVNGDSIDVFGPDGKFMYTWDDGSGTSTNGGIAFTKSKVNKDGSITYSGAITFTYNDPHEDHKSVVNDGYEIAMIPESAVQGMIDQSGVRSAEAQANPISYARTEGRPKGYPMSLTFGLGKKSQGKMDFYQSNPDIIRAYTLNIMIRNGKATAYNPKDFGNYMIGYAMKILGISLSTAQNGAHINNFLNTGGSDGGTWSPLDSYEDQRAIKDGYNHRTSTNLSNGISTHTNWTVQAKKQ
ncbi:MAG: hypothetical protein HC817_07935 [Saprospiraceae bacterium]|nr:hypothetical protein [Saprospiraceae bacterium]